MKSTLTLAIITTLFLFSCKEKEHPVNFYYWKSNMNIGDTEQQYFTDLQCEKLYVRVFDVDKTGRYPEPIAVNNKLNSSILNAEYVPVVFVTNRSLVGLSALDVKLLATNVYNLILQTFKESGINDNYTEIQIDCDWTQSTRENYFNLLQALRDASQKKITSTIRLHQIKFMNKTGVPPVDKGYIMCYATTNPDDASENNSILDLATLKDYMDNVNNYPLEFDIALPLYSWAIVTNHIGRIKLINGVTTEQLDSDTVNFTKVNSVTYKVLDDTFFRGMYLNKDFTVKVEEISPSLLKETKDYLRKKIDKSYNIVYYHLDSIFVKRFNITDLK